MDCIYNQLYDNCNAIDEVFTTEQINLMFDIIVSSRDYLKTIWGNWMKARDLCILASLRYLLLRPGEACGVAFKDFNLDKKTVIVRGENNKEKKDRIISLSENFLKYYFFFLSFPIWMWKGSPYLFPSAENQHISAGRWKTIMREKILKPAGLWQAPENGSMPRTRSYLLRATGATEMLDKGADPWTVAQTLGHSDLRTVKNYFFQTEKFRERQRECLNSLS